MDKIQSKLNISLSDTDLYKLLGKKLKIIRFPDLATYENIFECFGKSNMFVIFFETENGNTGHWECCMIDRRKKIITFFDSYGLAPDQAENYLNNQLKMKLKENQPLLKDMFVEAEKSGYECIYSSYPFQEMKNDVSTCGRHVVVRLKNINLNCENYFQYLNTLRIKYRYPTFDDVVTKLTEKY